MYPHTLYLTNSLRMKLKSPIGTPVYGPPSTVTKEFMNILKNNLDKRLITVGDIVSQSFDADIKIFDERNMRNTPVKANHETRTLKNPPSSINEDAWPTLENALKSNKQERIKIEGEEDMLVLPLILLADENTIIVYGLPGKGISYIIPDKDTKKQAQEIIHSMRKTRFKKTILGGTFDHLHEGHESLIKIAPYYTESLLIGITSDAMAKKKPYPEKIEPLKDRIKNLESITTTTSIDHEITTIDDIFGPAKSDPEADSIILTEETFENGKRLNIERKNRGQNELDFIVLPYVLGPDNKKISSSDIRKQETRTNT